MLIPGASLRWGCLEICPPSQSDLRLIPNAGVLLISDLFKCCLIGMVGHGSKIGKEGFILTNGLVLFRGVLMLSPGDLRDQGSTFSLVQININKYIYKYINIYYTFYSFLSTFVYYTCKKFGFKEASEQLLQDNISDNVHLGEFYACSIFYFLSVSF